MSIVGISLSQATFIPPKQMKNTQKVRMTTGSDHRVNLSVSLNCSFVYSSSITHGDISPSNTAKPSRVRTLLICMVIQASSDNSSAHLPNNTHQQQTDHYTFSEWFNLMDNDQDLFVCLFVFCSCFGFGLFVPFSKQRLVTVLK